MSRTAWAACVSRAQLFYERSAPWLPPIEKQLENLDGERFVSDDGTLGAVLCTSRVGEEELAATWGPRVSWKAIPIMAAVPTGEAIAQLLGRLNAFKDENLSPHLRNLSDCALSVSWPAFVDVSVSMTAANFRPMTTLAGVDLSTLRISAAPLERDRWRVVSMTDVSMSFVVDAWLELLREEAQFGAVRPRRSTNRLIAERVQEWLEKPDVYVAVAESAGALVGFAAAHLLTPDDALSRKVSTASAWYADAALVIPRFRGLGVGHELAQGIRDRVEQSGRKDVFLHYSEGSGLSGPFWRSIGVAPRWVSWWRDV